MALYGDQEGQSDSRSTQEYIQRVIQERRVERVNRVIRHAMGAIAHTQNYLLSGYTNSEDRAIFATSEGYLLKEWLRDLSRARGLIAKGQWAKAAEHLSNAGSSFTLFMSEDNHWPNYRGDSHEASKCRSIRQTLRSAHEQLELVTDFYYGALSEGSPGAS